MPLVGLDFSQIGKQEKEPIPAQNNDNVLMNFIVELGKKSGNAANTVTYTTEVIPQVKNPPETALEVHEIPAETMKTHCFTCKEVQTFTVESVKVITDRKNRKRLQGTGRCSGCGKNVSRFLKGKSK